MLWFKKSKPTVAVDDRLKHIAFIMDGNGRWAQKRNMPRELGHRAGAKAFRSIVLYCETLGLRALTVYAFSTENWKRPLQEVAAIMDLLDEYIDSCEKELAGHDVRFCFLGDKGALRPSLQEKMTALEEKTARGQMILNIAVNYGGRAELCRAAQTVCDAGEAMSEQAISKALYTSHCPDPDVIVRTGGDMRLSNFLLWQSAYAELYFSDKLWPDFTPQDVDAVIEDFYSRKRRYGGV